jgi:RimJ/RimL family protein N-acetyltransferase
LLLRPVTADDLAELVRLHAHPEVERFMDRFDLEKARGWLGDVQRCWAERGYGRMVILDRATGRILGRSGLQWLEPLGEPELGWTLGRDAWGHGYATEAALAVADWGFRELELEQIISLIEQGNERSEKVAERLGMSVIRTGVWYDRQMRVRAVTRNSFAERAADLP